MKITLRTTSALARLHRAWTTALALALTAVAASAQIVHQSVPSANRETTPTTWFQVLNGGGGSPAGNSGVLNVGTGVFGSPALLYGAWLTFTPQGTFVTYIGGTTSTVQINDPSGAPLADIRGAALLASTFDLGVDSMTGSLYTVTLYSGVILWNASHSYLLLLGGPPTTYELTDGAAPLAGVRGVARLAAQVQNTGTVLLPNYILFSGAALYSSAKAWLTTTAGLIATSEITFGGASIPGVRGFTAMGGNATPAMLDSGSFFYTAGHTFLMLTGPGISVYDVTTPAGAPIANTWGVVRQSPLYTGGGFFQGAAVVMTNSKQWLVLAGGGISTTEIQQASGASLISDVLLSTATTIQRQASGLQEALATWLPGGGGMRRGTVIGNQQ